MSPAQLRAYLDQIPLHVQELRLETDDGSVLHVVLRDVPGATSQVTIDEAEQFPGVADLRGDQWRS